MAHTSKLPSISRMNTGICLQAISSGGLARNTDTS